LFVLLVSLWITQDVRLLVWVLPFGQGNKAACCLVFAQELGCKGLKTWEKRFALQKLRISGKKRLRV